MEAILGVLKGGGDPHGDIGESARSPELPEHDDAVQATGDSDRAF
jgi:hypothetical protein